MDQVSRPFQIALVAVVLLAGMWFTVLRPKSGSGSTAPVAAAPAPGVTGLSNAVDKAHGAAATSDAANAAVQAATGGSATPASDASTPATPAAKPSAAATHHASKPAAAATHHAAKPAAAKATTHHASKPAAATHHAAKPAAATATTHAAKPAAAKPSAPATTPATDPSAKLLASLRHGKTVVFLFHGHGADDRAARQAVRQATRGDHHVEVAMAPISKVGDYEAITAQTNVMTAPTILVIGTNRQAVTLTGYVDQRNVAQAIGDVRRAAKKTAAK